ncbi:MAG: hypothetical protein ACO1RX_10780 [Candidatus Sericytochromatia bacterium]
MTRIPPRTAAIQNTLRESLADRSLSANEFKQLSTLIRQSPDMSASAKDKLIGVLDEARKDSQGFLFFQGKISPQEGQQLLQAAQSLGNSPVANQLRESLTSLAGPAPRESAATESATRSRSTRDQSSVNTGNQRSASFSPDSGGFFERLFGRRNRGADEAEGTQRSARTSGRAGSPSFNRIHVSQNGTGLSTAGRDCGPANAAMVAKHFGFLPQNTSDREAVTRARQASGNRSTAFSEDNLAAAVSGMTGGRVRRTSMTPVNTPAGLRSAVQAQLNQGALPIIEVGSPYRSSGPGRHYMVALEVKANGNIVVADPGGRGNWEITPAKLQDLINRGNARGNYVMGFNQ